MTRSTNSEPTWDQIAETMTPAEKELQARIFEINEREDLTEDEKKAAISELVLQESRDKFGTPR